MGKTVVFVCGLTAALCGPAVMGQTWFTDDFDTYFTGACVDPFCDCTADQAAFQANWQAAPGNNVSSVTQDGTCPSGFWGWDAPFAWVNKKGAFQAVRNLAPAIQAASGNPNHNAVNGTTLKPLQISFHLYVKTGQQGFTSLWLQLFAGDPGTMMAPITTPGLSTCTSNVCVGGPLDSMACTSDADCNSMKLDRTGTAAACNVQDHTPTVPRPSMAFGYYGGYNGLQPKPPCANIANRGVYRPVLFDGNAWWTLDAGDPPGSSGDAFGAYDRDNTVVITVRETDMDITLIQNRASTCTGNVCVGGPHNGMACTGNGECITFTKTGIPRQYTGAFQAIGLGSGAIDDTNSVQGPGTEIAGYIDSIDIEGGVFETLPTGSCCQPDGSCIDGVIQAACEKQGGSFAGAGTTCATYNCLGPTGACCLPTGGCTDTLDEAGCLGQGGRYDGAHTHCGDVGLPLCCPTPFADKDADGDVDQSDFGDFQACFTGIATGVGTSCLCFDRTHDNKIDMDDYALFADCLSGPEIPWTQAASCVP